MTTSTRWCAIIIGCACVLTGCPEIDEAIYCFPPEEPAGPPICEEYYEACIEAALDAYDVDVERIGEGLAAEVYVGNQRTCSEGWHACVEWFDGQEGEGQ